MDRFRRILYVTEDIEQDGDALREAVSLTLSNDAELGLFLVHPKIPESLGDFRESFDTYLARQARQQLDTVLGELGQAHLPHQERAPVEVFGDHGPDVAITQTVLSQGYDMVIKAAALREEGPGYRALDMGLLRKCPAAVWLHRPLPENRSNRRLAVALEPARAGTTQEQLALHLLQVAGSLAHRMEAELTIIACWDSVAEDYLRHHIFAKVSDEELRTATRKEESAHLTGVRDLLRKAPPPGQHQLKHLRGDPAALIPKTVVSEGVDLLVMGTVARTGIPGFVIGNTAENVLQHLRCSLLALKPPGFRSPVTTNG